MHGDGNGNVDGDVNGNSHAESTSSSFPRHHQHNHEHMKNLSLDDQYHDDHDDMETILDRLSGDCDEKHDQEEYKFDSHGNIVTRFVY